MKIRFSDHLYLPSSFKKLLLHEKNFINRGHLLLPLMATAQIRITLHADKGKDTISKNIYGHFAEHLGHCIYGGFYVGDNNKKIPNKMVYGLM